MIRFSSNDSLACVRAWAALLALVLVVAACAGGGDDMLSTDIVSADEGADATLDSTEVTEPASSASKVPVAEGASTTSGVQESDTTVLTEGPQALPSAQVVAVSAEGGVSLLSISGSEVVELVAAGSEVARRAYQTRLGQLVVVYEHDGGGLVRITDPSTGEVKESFGYDARPSPFSDEVAIVWFGGLSVLVDDQTVTIDDRPAVGNNPVIWIGADRLAWVAYDNNGAAWLAELTRTAGSWTLTRETELGLGLGSTTLAQEADAILVSTCQEPSTPSSCPSWATYRVESGSLTDAPFADWSGGTLGSVDHGRLVWVHQDGTIQFSDPDIAPLDGAWVFADWVASQ